MLSLEVVSFIFGAILVALAISGGGNFGLINIPPLGNTMRIIAAILGGLFIILAVWLNGQSFPSPSIDPMTTSNGSYTVKIVEVQHGHDLPGVTLSDPNEISVTILLETTDPALTSEALQENHGLCGVLRDAAGNTYQPVGVGATILAQCLFIIPKTATGLKLYLKDYSGVALGF